MSRVLVSWIGNTDLRAPQEQEKLGLGPIAQALSAQEFQRVVLVTDYAETRINPYRKWLAKQTPCKVDIYLKTLSSPTNFGEIYEAARSVVNEVVSHGRDATELVFHLSPGTPAMAAVWIILAKTRFPAVLIESSVMRGVQTVSFPFDIAAEFIPDLLRGTDQKLVTLTAAEVPDAPEFRNIIYRSRAMKRVVAMALQIAPRSVPVLLEGESGTGKELFARAIHSASLRHGKPFVGVNCGAIPSELVESELFGHEKGAFTGAVQSRTGYFENAQGGTLFLDEVGELPLQAQVKLLRVLQESEVMRIGGKQPQKIDVRIIAATNRNLLEEASTGKFRPDLFYRLAVGVIKLPPLREREGDMGLLSDHFLEVMNAEGAGERDYKAKKLSVAARKLIMQYRWPGNVRELGNTLLRAAIWGRSERIEVEDIKDAMLPDITELRQDILDRPLGIGLKLPELLGIVARHYLERALENARGNKSAAASMVGLPSYQTFTNWMERYKVDSGKKRA